MAEETQSADARVKRRHVSERFDSGSWIFVNDDVLEGQPRHAKQIQMNLSDFYLASQIALQGPLHARAKKIKREVEPGKGEDRQSRDGPNQFMDHLRRNPRPSGASRGRAS